MDYVFYRELISGERWMRLDASAETVAASINTSLGYDAGTLLSVHALGAGRFVLNTLAIRPPGHQPARRAAPAKPAPLCRLGRRQAAGRAAGRFREQLKAWDIGNTGLFS